jgi:ribonuclease Z
LSNISSNLELVFLGTGNAFSMAQRYWGSILVNDRILLDASPIVVPHMKKLDRSLSKLEYIFITHFHADHFYGVPFLLLDYAYLVEMTHPLVIIGPTGIKNKITQATDLGFTGVLDKLKDRMEIIFFEVTGPGEYRVSGLNFNAMPMAHGNAEAYGYKLTVGGKTIGYTGDTDLCDGVFDLGDGADFLIIELSNPNDDVPGHMSLQKIQKLQEQLSPNVKIILNHAGPITGELPRNENLILPNDLDVIMF